MICYLWYHTFHFSIFLYFKVSLICKKISTLYKGPNFQNLAVKMEMPQNLQLNCFMQQTNSVQTTEQTSTQTIAKIKTDNKSFS